jgi:hypothetical protein
MLSSTSEKKLRFVRAFLLAGWLLLIVSLFWDPYSHVLTDPASAFSPFAPWISAIQIQGHWLEQTPYAMGNRIFWTMILPILPIFIMVFGHEAWRRICPLSFVSQIPGYLGIRRMIRRFDRATGKKTEVIPLISRNSWLAKNALWVQFSLLVLGLCCRLWFANSDRMGLAALLLGVMASALVVGILWGGKTWCHYFCPVGVVQRIYTEPSGLLDSKPHIQIASLPQSMCRTPAREGDISACVGCTASCPDIDLEKSYWESIGGEKGAKLKSIYFGFVGLIWGFYTYFYLYSGDWLYYFSGIWTHEDDQIGQLFNPGLYIDDTPIGIPKIVAVPLVLVAFVLVGIVLGKTLSRIYIQSRQKLNPGVATDLLTHQVLSVTAYVAIMSFYIFGGRPTLNNLPLPISAFLNILIAFLATLWLVKSLRRTRSAYQNEGFAPVFRKQMQSLGVALQSFLGSRNLQDLNADEVCVLATAPGLQSEQQRVAGYRALLEEFAKDSAPQLLATIRDAQVRLHITKQEHQTIARELQIYLPFGGGEAGEAGEDDGRLFSLLAFRQELSSTLQERGMTVNARTLSNPAVLDDILRLRSLYAVTEIEWNAVFDQLSASSDQDIRLLRARLEELADLTALRVLLRAHRGENARADLAAQVLLKEVLEESKQVLRRLLAIIQLADESEDLQHYASKVGSLAGSALDEVLLEAVPTQPSHSWHEVLHPLLVEKLLASDISTELESVQSDLPGLRALIDDEARGLQSLENLILQGSNCIAASAFVMFSQFNLADAKVIAEQKLEKSDPEQFWLLAELLSSDAETDKTLSNMDKFLWLSGTPLLAQVTPTKIAEIARQSTSEVFTKNHYIFKQGDQPNSAIFLVEGELAVEKSDGATLAILKPGTLTGELGLLTGKPRTASLKVLSADTLVIEIGGQELNQLIERDSSVAASILRTVAGYI